MRPQVMEELGGVDEPFPTLVTKRDSLVVLSVRLDDVARGVSKRIECVHERVGFVLDERTAESGALVFCRVRLRHVTRVVVKRPEVVDRYLPAGSAEEANKSRSFARVRNDRKSAVQIRDEWVAQNAGHAQEAIRDIVVVKCAKKRVEMRAGLNEHCHSWWQVGCFSSRCGRVEVSLEPLRQAIRFD